MATYLYKREDGSLFEIEHSMSQGALTKCPTSGQTVVRVPQSFGSMHGLGTDFHKDAKRAALPKTPAP